MQGRRRAQVLGTFVALVPQVSEKLPVGQKALHMVRRFRRFKGLKA